MIHLFYLHQGYTARYSDLNALAGVVSRLLEGESYIARANPYRTSTMGGIDMAAERATLELEELLDTRPDITSLSLIGVSLGGCILEQVAENIRHRVLDGIVFRYFITFASPLNGISIGWNLPTLVAKLAGWLDTTLSDLISMHNKTRETVEGIALFQKRICLGNLKGDWRVPLSSAFPVGGFWPWSVGTHRVLQIAIDRTSCIWHTVTLDLSDRWRGAHQAIVDDSRSFEAICDILRDRDFN